MPVIPVNTADPHRLKILFPSLALGIGYPVYSRLVYSDTVYPSNADLHLVSSPSGVSLDSHLGLSQFLTDIDYFGSPSKLSRFIKAGAPPVKDNNNRVITEAGPFYNTSDIPSMYFYCSFLRVSNRQRLPSVLDTSRVIDILEASSLGERISLAESFGYAKFLTDCLSLIERFYDRSQQFNLPVRVIERIGICLSRFSARGFRDHFSITGDNEVDVQHLLCFFGK